MRHRRFTGVSHEFKYGLFMMYLDLDELDRLFRPYWLWSTQRWAPACFRRSDYMGDPTVPLTRSVRDLVQEKTGSRPGGPIRLLTHLRYFGYCFNPISVFYCFSADGEEVTHIVAEVRNTPWGERHSYVLPAGPQAWRGGTLRLRTPKAFHVSPFMEMAMDYHWTITRPGPRALVHIENMNADRRVLAATLDLERQEISSSALARVLLRYPMMTGQVIMGIHYQALKLWLKGARVHPHPGPASDSAVPAPGPPPMTGNGPS